MPKSKNLTAVAHRVGDKARQHRFGHDGAVVWLTGLSASGKSTLAMALEDCRGFIAALFLVGVHSASHRIAQGGQRQVGHRG